MAPSSRGDTGHAVVEVYVDKLTAAILRAIPTMLDSVPVKVVETGEITARTDSCSSNR